MRYEYKIELITFSSDAELLAVLNSFGLNGWEIIFYDEKKSETFDVKHSCKVLMKKEFK